MTVPLWILEDFITACNGTLVGMACDITGISIDSRTCDTGDAFFAIHGDRFDGHDFVDAALQKGAAIAVVERHRFEGRTGGPFLLVDDPLRAMERLATAARMRSRAVIIAVTGSVGKTGTKEALRTVFQQFGKTHASQDSFNNHWGVPLTLARLSHDIEYAIFEIGMNHAGEIEPLVKLVRPHIAIITTVAAAHLEFLGSVEAIADAKAEIFLGIEPGGTAILNRDNAYFDRLVVAAQKAGIQHVISFGEEEHADVHLQKIVLLDNCSTVAASVMGVPVSYRVGVAGRHHVQNSAAVLTSAVVAKVDLARAALMLATLQAPKGRGKRHMLNGGGAPLLLIDESYNANPESMRAALSTLAKTSVLDRGRRIAVLGDMLELGDKSVDLHAELAPFICQSNIDKVFCSGPDMWALWSALPANFRGGYGKDVDDLKPGLLAALGPGDALMIKGSLGSRMGKLVNAVLKRFPLMHESKEKE